jgi:hypothetical protein
MPLHYADMCDEVRALMIEEVGFDGDRLYISSYFTNAGASAWRQMLLDACERGDDQSLALAIRSGPYLKSYTERRTKSGFTQVKVPYNANEVIAESNFSRFYLRGLCRHATARGVPHLIGYRAMAVAQPRPGSQEKIGQAFPVTPMLDDLRATMDANPALGMPPGVGSGILARLP